MAIKLSQKQFIIKANGVHRKLYDYSKVNYTGVNVKVEIICKKHGIFFQSPKEHMRGQHCPTCGRVNAANSHKNTKNKFIEKSNTIHKYSYDYSHFMFTDNTTKSEIICSIHGTFLQSPKYHLRGLGCPTCGIIKSGKSRLKLIETFIEQSNIIHNNLYDYSQFSYIGCDEKSEIICKKHGSFFQSPTVHLSGSGCPYCSTLISKNEKRWLDSLNLPDDKQHRQVLLKIKGKKFRVDGFNSKTNIVYEYNGDFWHGNPKIYNSNEYNPITKTTFGELYERTILKQELILTAGYQLEKIWESDFLPDFTLLLSSCNRNC